MSKKLPIRASIACPCRKPDEDVSYGACCAAFHGLERLAAPTPEALMRSRYSAYALGLVDHLLATWHASTSPGELELGTTRWLGLDVLHTEASEDAGVVDFVARYKENGRAGQVAELSRFVREGGAWFYVDGLHHSTD